MVLSPMLPTIMTISIFCMDSFFLCSLFQVLSPLRSFIFSLFRYINSYKSPFMPIHIFYMDSYGRYFPCQSIGIFLRYISVSLHFISCVLHFSPHFPISIGFGCVSVPLSFSVTYFRCLSMVFRSILVTV